MMRQTGKQILTIAAWVLIACGLIGAVRAGTLVTTVVTDPLTGVAIDGYDPVTYFTDPAPVMGKPDYEYDWQGVPWYFESAANRDVFIRNPTVYAPQYGGHCLMSLSRGYLSDGQPQIYVIQALKLYLFYSQANRDAFAMSKQNALDTAAKNWPGLSQALTTADNGATSSTLDSAASASASGGAQDAASSAEASAPSVAADQASSHVQSN